MGSLVVEVEEEYVLSKVDVVSMIINDFMKQLSLAGLSSFLCCQKTRFCM